MLENIPPDVHDIHKKIMIGLVILATLIGARVLCPEFFQCHNPECHRTHRGEP